MSIAFLVMLILSVITVVILVVAIPDMPRGRRMWLWCIPVFFFVMLIVTGSFLTVPAGHRGVLLRFGEVSGVLDEGLNTKIPIIDRVEMMSVQTQLYEADATSASKDLQDVTTSLGLNYKLSPSAAGEVYRTLGVDYIERIAKPAVQEVVKAITARYNAEDLILKREMVKKDIEETLSVRLADRGIILETMNITNFKFSATFTNAIEAKVAAEQAILEAENKLKRVEVEARQAKAKAEGEAAAILTKATAQDEANKILTQNLSEELLQYILIDRLGEDIKVMVIPSGQALTIGGIEDLLEQNQ